MTSAVARPTAPPLATKLEAFKDRGNRDFLGSRDFADVVALVDGREELLAECADAPADLRAFVASALRALREDDSFELGVAAALKPDPSSQLRADNVVLPRISELIDIGEV